MDLGEWVGYAVDWQGTRMTVVGVRPGLFVSEVYVDLAYPADWQRDDVTLTLLGTTIVEVLG